MRKISEHQINKQQSYISIPQPLMSKRLPPLPQVNNNRAQETEQVLNPFLPIFSMQNTNQKWKGQGIQKSKKIKAQSNEKQSIDTSNKRQVQQICEILSYYLCQYHLPQNSLDFDNKNRASPYNSFQIQEMKERFQNLSLGLFLIKAPNPDNPPEQLIKFYQKMDGQEDLKYVSLHQAFNLYNQAFQNQLPQNLNMSEKERVAFLIAFELLNVPQLSFEDMMLKNQKVCLQIDSFITTMQFYKIIQPLTVEEYEKLRKKEPKILVYQQNLLSQIKRDMNHLFLLGKINNSQKINQQFKGIKTRIKESLKKMIDLNTTRKQMDDNNSFLKLLLQRIPRVDFLFSFFPRIMKNILDRLEQKDSQKPVTRLLYGGGFLKKMEYEDRVEWIQTGNRPKDLVTLLRNVMTYKLSRRGNMFVRSFLSTCTQYLFLVIDCAESNMQIFSQNNSVDMEVQIGSIDLFSFEPVDEYYRPLRLNSYIRDKRFYQKYNLGNNKSDKDDVDPMKSVESSMANHYRNATSLNADILRVKIILQQEDLDKAYRWISDFLNIQYIEPQEVLSNDYNEDGVDRTQWEAYYIYTKLLIEYHTRIQNILQAYKRQNKIVSEIKQNLGLVYRLAFIKALYKANSTFKQHHKLGCWEKITRLNSNKLQNIWDYIDIQQPTAHTQYVSKKRLERIWRKYEVNEHKTRSKFVHSQRVYICNKIINRIINIAPSQSIKLISSYFPTHDPYVLKGIKIEPYLRVLRDQNLLGDNLKLNESGQLNDLLKQFECELTKSDFTSESLEQKLEFKIQNWRNYAQLSIPPIKDYAGTKLALYFNFSQFYTNKLKWMIPICLIVQILLWIQNSDVAQDGTSDLTFFNDVVLFIFSLVNMVWVTNLVQGWRKQEQKFSQQYGLQNLTSDIQTRNMFKGQFMRNMRDDNMNHQYTPGWKKTLKIIYSTTISILFLGLVISTVIIIFIFKGYMIQLNYDSTTSSIVPALLISITSEVYNYFYNILARKLTDFQNHKTISQYQSSLIFKTYLIIFFDNFNSFFLYAFFSFVFPSLNFCEYKTVQNTTISNCSLQVSNQMLTSTLIKIAVDFVQALYPYLMFKWKQYKNRKKNNYKTNFTLNYFQSIDQFYEQQDQMTSFMYNQQIDMTSISYTSMIIKITCLILFAPALPFAYFILYLDGIFSIHAQKFKILMLSQRAIPIKTKSIGMWKQILTIISFLGVVVNLAYVIFTRKLDSQSASQIFFGFTISLLIFKLYLTIFYSEPQLSNTILNRRNQDRLFRVMMGIKNNTNVYKSAPINTDIRNVRYNESAINRNLTELTKANVKTIIKKNN